MTLDQLQLRDARITELEALGRARTRDQDHELGSLLHARDHFWRRIPSYYAKARARLAAVEAEVTQLQFKFARTRRPSRPRVQRERIERKVTELETYARQHGLPLA